MLELYLKRLNEKVEGAHIPHAQSKSSEFVTISIGVANIIPSTKFEQNQLLQLADKALYISKKNGRNRITCYNYEQTNEQ